jgi:hypothetical protein
MYAPSTPAIAPEARQLARGVRRHLGDARPDTREQVERDVAQVPDRVLHVVPEDVEEQEVPAEVQEPAVHEHAGEDRERFPRQILHEAARNEAVAWDEPGLPALGRDLELEVVDDDVEGEQAIVHERRGSCRVAVADRKHASTVARNGG